MSTAAKSRIEKAANSVPPNAAGSSVKHLGEFDRASALLSGACWVTCRGARPSAAVPTRHLRDRRAWRVGFGYDPFLGLIVTVTAAPHPDPHAQAPTAAPPATKCAFAPSCAEAPSPLKRRMKKRASGTPVT
jgi:hypothetical protein